MNSGPIPYSLQVRGALQSDLDQILVIEQQAMTAAHWPRATYEALLNAQESAQRRRCLVVGDRANKIVAFCVVSFLQAVRTAELENIAVTQSVRRTGIGRALLHYACDWSREQGASELHAEVRESGTAARDLYLTAGFQQTARRIRYYQSPVEDALLLTLHL